MSDKDSFKTILWGYARIGLLIVGMLIMLDGLYRLIKMVMR